MPSKKKEKRRMQITPKIKCRKVIYENNKEKKIFIVLRWRLLFDIKNITIIEMHLAKIKIKNSE